MLFPAEKPTLSSFREPLPIHGSAQGQGASHVCRPEKHYLLRSAPIRVGGAVYGASEGTSSFSSSFP